MCRLNSENSYDFLLFIFLVPIWLLTQLKSSHNTGLGLGLGRLSYMSFAEPRHQPGACRSHQSPKAALGASYTVTHETLATTLGSRTYYYHFQFTIQ